MKNFRSLLILFILLFATGANAASRVEYILDVSGSMNALSGGEKRIDAAKKAIGTMVNGIPDGSIVALRLYSHRIAPSDKEKSCQDTELVVPFGPINKANFMAIVNATSPLGQTPIAYSLQQAANDFVMGADEQQSIILVSDGEESCGGDPVAVAKDLLAKGFKLTINVIGMDVDAAAKNQLAGIASATGGQYFDAKDAASLTSSLQQLTNKSLVIEKAGSSVYGEETRGGDNYETAVPLPTGKLFRLNHHQKRNQYDYFYVEAKPGQKLVVSLETGEKGVDIAADNTVTENLNPYAGISLQSPLKTQLKDENIIGSKNSSKQIIYGVPPDGAGKYYVLIGSGYESQHKDHRFKVEIAEQFDAGTKQDAGETRDTALSIQPGTIKGFLNPNDNVDAYKVSLPAGNLNVKVRPSSEKGYVKLLLSDSDGVEVAHGQAPNEGAVAKLENVPLAKSGEYILKVSNLYDGLPETEYTMDIVPAGAAAPTADLGAPPTTPTTPATPTTPETPTTPTTPAAPATPTTPAAPSTPTSAAPSAPTAVYNQPSFKLSPYPGGGPSAKAMCEGFKLLSWWEKTKFLAFWSGIPLVAGWLIGMLWGYFKGRSSGKRWAAKQAARVATQPPPTPPK